MRRCYVVLATALFANAAAATDNVVTIGGLELRPGMSRESVIPKLRASYKVSCVDSRSESVPDSKCQSFIVESRTEPSSDSSSVANVVFKGNRVEHIRKYWASAYNVGDAAPFAKTLGGLITRLNGGTGKVRQLNVATTQSQEPWGRTTDIVIYNGSRSIQIKVYEGTRDKDGREQRATVTMDEVVE